MKLQSGEMSVLHITCSFLFVLLIFSCKTQEEESATKDLDTHDGYTVYKWPNQQSIEKRNYTALGKQMTEFAVTVGHCLHRAATGVSETAWLCNARAQNRNNVYAARGNARNFCNAVKDELLKFLPTTSISEKRSEYCQYANCGEGGLIGACLAYDFGFSENEIRVCKSDNDHVFAMVLSKKKNDWCLLDRWSNIGTFRCGVNWDPPSKTVSVDGVTTKEKWFQLVSCRTLEEFVRDPR